jgi:hypothetical protein
MLDFIASVYWSQIHFQAELPGECYPDQSQMIKSEYFPVILIGSGKGYPLQGVNCQYNANSLDGGKLFATLGEEERFIIKAD